MNYPKRGEDCEYTMDCMWGVLFFDHALADRLTVAQNWNAQAANTFGYFKDESMARTVIDKYRFELLWYFTKFLPERG